MDDVNPLVIDVETNGKDERFDPDFRIMGIGVHSDSVEEYMAVGHLQDNNYTLESAKERLLSLVGAHTHIIFHNASADLQFLDREGIDLWNSNWYCTMLMAHWVNENLMNKGLDAVGKHYVGEGKTYSTEMEDIKLALGWEFIPRYLMESYALQDVRLPLKIFRELYPQFVSEGFDGELWNWERRFTKALVKLECEGLSVDVDLANEQIAIGKARMAEIELELGGSPLKHTFLKELLVDRLGITGCPFYTSKGAQSFNKKAMEWYDDVLQVREDPTARLVLEYRGWAKAISTYYEAFLKHRMADGRVRTHLNNHRARSSRLSSERPNFQNVPKETDDAKPWNRYTKKCIVSKEDWELYEFDYSNLEFRLAAAYADQQNLIEYFNSGKDIWKQMMADTNLPEKGQVKGLTYSLNYGAGDKKIQAMFGFKTLQEAKDLKAQYFAPYPGIQAIGKKASAVAEKQGYITMWTGRRRHFGEKVKGKYGLKRQESTHKAFNAYLQGGAAEIVKRALVRCYEEVCDSDCRLVLTVHDSIVFEIKRGSESKYLSRIAAIMEQAAPEEFGVRFPVGVHVWGTDTDINIEEYDVAC